MTIWVTSLLYSCPFRYKFLSLLKSYKVSFECHIYVCKLQPLILGLLSCHLILIPWANIQLQLQSVHHIKEINKNSWRTQLRTSLCSLWRCFWFIQKSIFHNRRNFFSLRYTKVSLCPSYFSLRLIHFLSLPHSQVPDQHLSIENHWRHTKYVICFSH